MRLLLIFLAFGLAATLSFSTTAQANGCRYFSYVQYGTVMYGGNPQDMRKGFRVGPVRKTAGNTSASSASGIINIGPFDSESALILERSLAVDDVKAQGYVRSGNFTFPGVVIHKQKDC
ncbi:hypothetical protein [Amylibacter sp. IMCC11727]|uniref:hypothetical protein n=1 Tax=Amylibacter sp. IMCC11727 TaxID=3039851 RepID=UPI00244E4D3F|nr:hypothetical protein [Amylibacter sp. IMCC11727]WGI21342.1 hypothetical protein QBD29_14665 [Amylibacter sp. IMCC11727]